MNTLKKSLALLTGLLFAAAAIAGEFPDVSIAEVKAVAGTGKATIIDVNGTDSYNSGHVPGALNFDTIEADFAKALPADKNALIIAYCGNPRCTAYQAAAKVIEIAGKLFEEVLALGR
ncbi:MAG: rhodanese-like domain-containing protein [Verrucomicrobia bacterium]|nr:rhodanese-like domain-containing protein [Verrucomicrobiota bacterium]